MFTGLLSLLYPLSVFLFLRLALRLLGAWAARPRPGLLVAGVICTGFAFHAGWHLFAYAAVLPHRWVMPLIVIALAWVSYKSVRAIWQFQQLKTATEPGAEA